MVQSVTGSEENGQASEFPCDNEKHGRPVDLSAKIAVDILLKDYDISRREMADATNRNFDSIKFLVIGLFGYIGSVTIAGIKAPSMCVGNVPMMIYGAIVFVVILSIYLLISVSMYAFILARAFYEMRVIRRELLKITKNAAIMSFDIDTGN